MHHGVKYRSPPSDDGYVLECPVCTDVLTVDNTTAVTAERTRSDVLIHLLWHTANSTTQYVFPGTDKDLP